MIKLIIWRQRRGDKGKDNAIRIWDIARGQLIGMLVGHSNQVVNLLFVPGQMTPQLISLSKDNTIRFWNVSEEKQLRQFTSINPLNGSTCLSPDGQIMAVGCQSGSESKAVDTQKMKMLLLLAAMQGINLPSHLLQPKNNPPAIHFWDIVSGEILKTFTPHKNDKLSFCSNAQGSHFLLASSDLESELALWNVADIKQPQLSWKKNVPDITSVVFLPNDSGILTGSSAGIIQHEMTAGEHIRTYHRTGLQGNIYSITCQMSDNSEEDLIAAGDAENIEI